MSRLKSISIGSVSLAMFDTPLPIVNGAAQNVVLNLQPGEDVDQAAWLVEDQHSLSYNKHLIEDYINNNILTQIP